MEREEGDEVVVATAGISVQESSSEESESDSDEESSFPHLNDLSKLATNIDGTDSSESESEPEECADQDVPFEIDVTGTLPGSANARSHTVSSDSSDDEYTPVYDNKKVVSRNRIELSTKLEDGLDTEKLYTNVDAFKKNAKETLISSLSKAANEELMKKSVLSKDVEKKHALPSYQESVRATRKRRQQERANSKGKNWFDMKAPEMTEEQKNDLTVLQMRHALDPKSFYKHNDLKVLPKFFQMGKVVEHAADFYNSRIPKKQRKQTLVDELLADAEFRKYNKKKYTEVVQARSLPRGKIKLAKRMKKRKK